MELKREVRAKLVKVDEGSLAEAGERIRAGRLVAFPTETVYGLGADATNEEAVKSIFAAKERPFTDPVIVHIADFEILNQIFLPSPETEFIKDFGKLVWPGPITFIGPCNPSYIPLLVGSNTGSIGVRYPANKVAQELIKAAKRPIAAPSANKFMHVSPTSGPHVFDDLKYEDVLILDSECSELGVESTVVKVEYCKAESQFKVILLRTGTFEVSELERQLLNLHQYKNVRLVINKKKVKNTEQEVAVAPGQLLKHYSPYVQTFLLSRLQQVTDEYQLMESDLNGIGVVDFNQTNIELQDKVKYYRDLNPAGDYKAAMKSLYSVLREAEDPAIGLRNLFLVNLQTILGEYELAVNTLADKTFRSAAGVQIYYDEGLRFYSKKNEL